MRTMRTSTILSAVMLGLLAGPGHKNTTQSTTTSVSQTGKYDRFLQMLPQAIASRVLKLLAHGPYRCQPDDLVMGQLLGAPIGFGINRSTPNCYSTLYYAATGQTVLAIEAETSIARLLESEGYKMADISQTYKVEEDQTVGLAEGLGDNLKPGDALIFFGSVTGVTKPNHASLYLGRIGGIDYVFHKLSLFCSNEEDYQIGSLQDFLKHGIGYGFLNHPFKFIAVHRKSS